MIRRFRWWLSDLLERWSFAVQPPVDYSLDLKQLIIDTLQHTEPTETPFLNYVREKHN